MKLLRKSWKGGQSPLRSPFLGGSLHGGPDSRPGTDQHKPTVADEAQAFCPGERWAEVERRIRKKGGEKWLTLWTKEEESGTADCCVA